MKTLTEKLNLDKRNYPILAWYETDNQSKIIIISEVGDYKTISTFPNNINHLYQELNKIFNSKDLLKFANKGDEHTHSFTINEFPETKPNWDKLLTEVKAELNTLEVVKDLDNKIKEELINNQKYDLAAAALKCVYSSILYNMITKSLELGITEMMIIGDIIYERGLSSVIENNLPQDMTISYLQL